MSISVQHRRGTTMAHGTFTGKEGEITVDTTKSTAVVHDGSTAGGHPLATEAYTDTKIEEAFDALTAADVPTSDSSNVQEKLTSYASTLNSHTTTLSDHGSQLAENARGNMLALGIVLSKNRYTSDNEIANKWYSHVDGSVQDMANATAVKVFGISGFAQLCISSRDATRNYTTLFSVAFYSSETISAGTFISGVNPNLVMTTDGVVSVPASAVAAVVTVLYLSSARSTFQVESGASRTTYEAYYATTYKGIDSAGFAGSFKNQWNGKNVLVIGDSLTSAGKWQLQLSSLLGMVVTTHAYAGIPLKQMVDGNGGAFAALTAADVTGKDLIIVFGGYNSVAYSKGTVGDAPTSLSIAGQLQYVINAIYSLLTTAGNLACRVAIVTPHAVGKYPYADYDAYTSYSVSNPTSGTQTYFDVCDVMEAVAGWNSIPCYNACRKSGINSKTWTKFAANGSAYDATGSQGGTYPNNYDQLHLNNTYGYPHIGKRIAEWVANI